MASQQEQFQHQSEGIKSWLKRKTPKADRLQKSLDTKTKFYIALFGITLAASLYKQSFSSTTWASLCALVLLVEIYFDNRKLISLLRSKDEQDQRYVSNELDKMLIYFKSLSSQSFDNDSSHETGNSLFHDENQCSSPPLIGRDGYKYFDIKCDGSTYNFQIFQDFDDWQDIVFKSFPNLSDHPNNILGSVLNYCTINSCITNFTNPILRENNRSVPSKIAIQYQPTDDQSISLDNIIIRAVFDDCFSIKPDPWGYGILLPCCILSQFTSNNIKFFELIKLSENSFTLKPLRSDEYLSYADIQAGNNLSPARDVSLLEFIDSYQGIKTPLHLSISLGFERLVDFYSAYSYAIQASDGHMIPNFLHSIFAIDSDLLTIPMFSLYSNFTDSIDELKVNISDDQISFEYVQSDCDLDSLTLFSHLSHDSKRLLASSSVPLKVALEATLSDHLSFPPIQSIDESRLLKLDFNFADYPTSLASIRIHPLTEKHGFPIFRPFIGDSDQLITRLQLRHFLGPYFETLDKIKTNSSSFSVFFIETSYSSLSANLQPDELATSFRQFILNNSVTDYSESLTHEGTGIVNAFSLDFWDSCDFIRTLNMSLPNCQPHLENSPSSNCVYLAFLDSNGILLSVSRVRDTTCFANPLRDNPDFTNSNQFMRLSENLKGDSLDNLFWLPDDADNACDFDQTKFSQIIFDCLRHANRLYTADTQSFYYMHHKDDHNHRVLASLGMSPLSFDNIFVSCSKYSSCGKLDDVDAFPFDVFIDTSTSAFEINGNLYSSISLSDLLSGVSNLPCPADFDLLLLDVQDRAKFVVTTNDSSSIEGLPAKQQSTHKEFTPNEPLLGEALESKVKELCDHNLVYDFRGLAAACGYSNQDQLIAALSAIPGYILPGLHTEWSQSLWFDSTQNEFNINYMIAVSSGLSDSIISLFYPGLDYDSPSEMQKNVLEALMLFGIPDYSFIYIHYEGDMHWSRLSASGGAADTISSVLVSYCGGFKYNEDGTLDYPITDISISDDFQFNCSDDFPSSTISLSKLLDWRKLLFKLDVSELTYKVNVSQDGNIFIGPEYLRLLNLEPGDEFDVYIHGASDIILKPNPSEASAEHLPTGLSVTIDNKCIMVISRTSKLSLISDATYSIKFGKSYIRLSLESPCINDILSSYADSLRIHET